VKLSIFGGALFFLLDERVGLSKGGLCMVEVREEEKVGSLETAGQISFDVWRSGAARMNIWGASRLSAKPH
jgi:hypothetical protein